MPDDTHTLQGLLGLLEGLKNSSDDAIYSNKCQLDLLKNLNSVLSSGNDITSADADRVQKNCLHYIQDVRCAPYVLSIISSLINIEKTKPNGLIDFLPSATAILNFLRVKCGEDKTHHLRILSFQVLMSHPKSTLTNLVTNHISVLIETFRLFLSKESLDAKIESFTLLQLLHLLPTNDTSEFVKEGIPLWLSSVFPCFMQILISIEDKEKIQMCLSYVESLSKQLVQQDYFEYPQWEHFLGCVVDPKKFPLCIKNLLEKGHDTWHRVWILIVKLLKGYITRNFSSLGTPINSMLPVVETAFKRDSIQRVQAFMCWNELIRNFSNETNAHCIAKRVRLVIIPLRLNNIKTEDAAVAKFDTWWLLIRKFKLSLNILTDDILIMFIQFAFGKEQSSKPMIWAGQLTDNMKMKCLEAFVEIVGHSDCYVNNTCTSIIKPLRGKVLTGAMLLNNWKDWLYALKMAVKIVIINCSVAAKLNLRCIWKSLVLLITELPDYSLRQDRFNDLIKLLSVFIKESVIINEYVGMVDIMIEYLILPLFRDKRFETLLRSKNQDLCIDRPMYKIMTLITDKSFDNYYKRLKPEDLTTTLEPIAKTLMRESVTTPAFMTWLLDELPTTDSSLVHWTFLVRMATNSDMCPQVYTALLNWPFKMIQSATDVKDAALSWYTLYDIVHVKLDKTFDNEISKVLTKPVDDSGAANYFMLFALIGVIKHKPDEDKMAKLEALTYEMNNYREFEPLVPSLVDTLALMMDKASTKNYENLAQITINCVNNVIKMINLEATKNASSKVRVNLPYANKTVLTEIILTAMKKNLAKYTNESIKKEIQNVISSIDNSGNNSIGNTSVETPKKTDVAPKEFASPKVQEVKKTKRKEASIVNTVVENGEEYVVVKSNWKFNPKNLTENQKEKFQRKRDIPALYQDLSQSQDEFKLSTWKTDSQDTSLSSSKSSKSATNNDASEILRNMSSTDVVPKIMENLLDNAKNNQQNNANTSPVPIAKLPQIDKVATPKSTKSPRMALKDRVFRNVRNLIEKSSPSPRNELKDKHDLSVLDDVPKSPIPKKNTEKTEKEEDLKQIKSPIPTSLDDNHLVDKQENQSPKATDGNKNKVIIVTAKKNNQNITLICTPVTKSNKDNNVTNSAPPLLCTERPARMKRKPKKFEDSLLLKKSRQSNNDSQNDSQVPNYPQTEVVVAQVHTTKEKKDIEQAQKIVTEDVDAVKKLNKDKVQTVVDDDIIMDCDVLNSSNKESYITEKAVTTPTTPITDTVTEKSPEKPSCTEEVPSDKDKASEGIEKDLQQIKDNDVKLLTEKQLLKKTKEFVQQKPLLKINKVHNDTITTSVSNMCLVLDRIDDKPSAKKSAVENETDIDNKNLEALSTPINKTNNDTNQQKSAKTNVIQKETDKDDEQTASVTTEQTKVSLANSDVQAENKKKEDITVSVTPKNKPKNVAPKSSMKKEAKKSRIEKELMIDMVEGHPFLKAQSEKRLTRKQIMEAENSSRRKTVAEKLNKSKLEATPKTSKKPKEKKVSPTRNTITVEESQDKRSISPDDIMDEPPCSEDIIESSQDSTITTISTKSNKKITPKHPFVVLEKYIIDTKSTQDLIEDCEMIDVREETHEKTDIELTRNKTAEVDKNTIDLTENMETQPMEDKNDSDNVIILDETETSPIISSEPVIGLESQELADADTQPNDPKQFIAIGQCHVMSEPCIDIDIEPDNNEVQAKEKEVVDNNITKTLPETVLANIDDTSEVSSPFKGDNIRKQDFLNNTLEISPIKIQSPDREKKSPSPETSSDFVVIKLSSPVHSNGEPFEKHGSPEFFTEDKVSPDKRDVSPPRAEVTVANTSPSSSLSLKKNRPQVRPGGRAAQMLDLLCVNSDLKVTKVSERIEPEDTKKASTSTPARRNLRILYNSVGDNCDNLSEMNLDDTDNFLRLKRVLPTVTRSPSILKRKLVDIADEATASPASKRKRVSFHDPPVSTCISVYKYIEPLSMVRSPQSSAKKRLERQMRSGMRSPKRLDNAFNLDSVLSKTVESFIEIATPTDDTQNISLDITPVVEIVKTSELNDTDPFFPDLIDCKEPIDVIATELSSPAMRDLFIKELLGKVETVGDLSKMTELEINRLCIKAPKIQTAKKVLTDYASKQPEMEMCETVIEEDFSEPMTESLLISKASVEMQTDEPEVSSTEMQTVAEPVVLAATQTEEVVTAHTSMQTDECSKSTVDIVPSGPADSDFLEKLEKLDEESIKTIAEKLTTKTIIDLLMKKSVGLSSVFNRLLKTQSKGVPKDMKSSAELSFVKDALCERYEGRDLILLCSQILQKIHDKPA